MTSSGPSAKELSQRRLRLAIGTAIAVLAIAAAVIFSIGLRPIPDDLETRVISDTGDIPTALQKALAEDRYDDALTLALNYERQTKNANTQTLLGMLYFSGLIGQYQPNYCRSAQWFFAAAQQGRLYAQIILSVQYAVGQGVRRDPAMAYYWMRRAESQLGTVQKWPEFYYDRLVATLQVIVKENVPEFSGSVESVPPIVTLEQPADRGMAYNLPYPFGGQSECNGEPEPGFNALFTEQRRQSAPSKLINGTAALFEDNN